MANLLACPGPDQLKSIALGVMPERDAEALIEHLEQCVDCATGISIIMAEDTLVEAVRAKVTVVDSRDRQAVSRLVEKVRALVPDAKSATDQTLDSVAPSAVSSGDTAAFSWVDQPAPEEKEDDGLALPQAPDEIGRLGPYRVLKVLGQGGMGKVFLAEDPNLQRFVALKVMKASLAKNSNARQRFLREARLAAKIEHDHIVHIYQVGEDRGIPFLAMQLLKGTSLEDLLRRSGTLKIKQVLRIGIQVAQGLAAAHEHGMIHRDIKPSNVWIEPTGGGRVKILDFGLARTSQGEVGITQSGTILGTPAYMPPEQARGEKVDQRCDLYSLGCVIYRMATGELPIKGNDTMGMLMALALNEVTAPAKLNPEIPQAFSDLIMKLLAKDRNQRVGSAKEVVQALQAIERGDSVPAPNDTAVLAPSMLEPRPDSEHQRRLMMAATVPPRADLPMAATTTKSIPDGRAAPRRRAPVLGGVAIAVVLALVGGGILFGAQVFRIVTNQGELVVDVKDPNVEVKIVQNGVVVHDKASKREFTLTAGKGLIEVLEKDGIKLATKQFELTRGGKTTVTVTLQELADARNPDDAWLKMVAAMPADKQVEAVKAELIKRNPGFDGKIDAHTIDERGIVTLLRFNADKVTDISPVRALPGLKTLQCEGSSGNGMLANLSPLKGMMLTSLNFRNTKVADLLPLKDMKLTVLRIHKTLASDLSPLRGMPLTYLDCESTKVADLAPLKGMPLKTLTCDFEPKRDAANLRSIKTLETINGKPAAAFWKDVDAGASEWVQLFNGKDLTGWTREKAGLANWKVDAGAITCSGPHDYLYTARNDFDDFHLRAEVKISDKGNSGIYFRTGKPLDIMSDYEAQINSTHKDPLKTGSLYHLVDVKDILVPADSWFTYEIIAQGSRIRLLVNGKETADYTEKRPNRRTKGHIALQLMAGTVHFRKIEIKRPTTSDDDFPELVAAMPAKEQVKAVADKLQELNPHFDGKVTAKYEGNVVTGLTFLTDNVTDISPVRALTGLRSLSCKGTNYEKGQLADLAPLKNLKLTSLYCRFNLKLTDLSPLQEMKLTELLCDGTRVSDLSPLRDMKLTILGCNATRVSDLSPLRDMPLLSLACWNTGVSDLSPLKGMPLTLLDIRYTRVADLSPLKGMPLTLLQIRETTVSDLSPLKDMQTLTHLDCEKTRVSDLTPLAGLPLKQLDCSFNSARDADLLRSIMTLEKINQKSALEFWNEVNLQQAAFDAWLKLVAVMPADKQVKAVGEKLKERNPDFDGKILSHKIDPAGVVTALKFWTDNVTDISPVRALPGLTDLDCPGTAWRKGKLVDLWPLKHLKLTVLNIRFTMVSDLWPLKEMKLTRLHCDRARVNDLAPLKNMPLTTLYCWDTPVSDLSPLKGMPLTQLSVAQTKVTDLSPLKNMPLTLLHIQATKVTDLTPLMNMPLTQLHCWSTSVTDLTPLRGMPLIEFAGTFKADRDAEILRSIKTLKTINTKPAAEFWKDVAAKQAAFDAWLKLVAAMPAQKQADAVRDKLKESNPGFDGRTFPTIDDKTGVVTGFELRSDKILDISPVRALTGLQTFKCAGTRVADLAPLKGMKLTSLDCSSTPVTDLSSLKGMPLTVLKCHETLVTDLSPLNGMPLKEIQCDFKGARDAVILRSIKTLQTINQVPAAEFWKDVDGKE